MKKLIIASLLGAMTFTASAQWVSGISYINMKEELHGDDLRFGGLVVNLKRDFSPEDKFHWLGGISYGIGIQDDSIHFRWDNGPVRC